MRSVIDEFTVRHDRLHVLVNDVGAHYTKQLVNADGIEIHVAVDHLAGFGTAGCVGAPGRWGSARCPRRRSQRG